MLLFLGRQVWPGHRWWTTTRCRRGSSWRRGSWRRRRPTFSASAGSSASCRDASKIGLWRTPSKRGSNVKYCIAIGNGMFFNPHSHPWYAFSKKNYDDRNYEKNLGVFIVSLLGSPMLTDLPSSQQWVCIIKSLNCNRKFLGPFTGLVGLSFLISTLPFLVFCVLW